jgi:hypothetical protein
VQEKFNDLTLSNYKENDLEKNNSIVVANKNCHSLRGEISSTASTTAVNLDCCCSVEEAENCGFIKEKRCSTPNIIF